MDVETFDWASALTTQGENFQDHWSRFMFNMDAIVNLQTKQVPKEKILEILQAGSAYLGGGWSTGRASQTLYQLSGVAIVKPQLEPYRDCWLFCIALIFQVDLPSLALPEDVAQAAFQLTHYFVHPEGEQPVQPPPQVHSVESSDDTDDDAPQFSWDEPEQELPRELLELWQRAATGKNRIDVRKLLETRPRVQGIPARAPDNQLVQEFKKKQDTFLKTVSQQLLNLVRLTSYRWIRGTDRTLELQLFQLMAELHFKICQERRELAVPGIKKREEATDGLFSEEDVKAQQAEMKINKLSMASETNFLSRGGFNSGLSEPTPFLVPTENSGHYHRSPWRVKVVKSAKGGKGFKGYGSISSSTWKGGYSGG